MSVWRRFRRKGIGIVDLCAKCKKMAFPHRRKLRELPKKSQGPRQHCAEYHERIVKEINEQKKKRVSRRNDAV